MFKLHTLHAICCCHSNTPVRLVLLLLPRSITPPRHLGGSVTRCTKLMRCDVWFALSLCSLSRHFNCLIRLRLRSHLSWVGILSVRDPSLCCNRCGRDITHGSFDVFSSLPCVCLCGPFHSPPLPVWTLVVLGQVCEATSQVLSFECFQCLTSNLHVHPLSSTSCTEDSFELIFKRLRMSHYHTLCRHVHTMKWVPATKWPWDSNQRPKVSQRLCTYCAYTIAEWSSSLETDWWLVSRLNLFLFFMASMCIRAAAVSLNTILANV